MAAVYSRRLSAGYYPPGTTATVYTAPSGITAVVRSVQVTNQTGSGGNCRIVDGGGVDFASTVGGALLETIVVNLRAVLESGDSIGIDTATDGFTVRISGYELD